MAVEPKIYSRLKLKEFILRKLGSPVVNIEITDDQLEDAIDETIEHYSLRAYSGVLERYVPITLLPGVHEYILPYDVFAVLAVHTVGMSGLGNAAATNMFSLNQFVAADLYKPGVAKIDMIGYEMINQMIETMNIIFSAKLTFDFNSISKVLHIFSENTDSANQHAIIQIYRKLDLMGTTNPVSGATAVNYLEENIYNEPIIKKLATAKAMKQWGTNLMKYTGSVLPNGGTLNSQWIFDTGTADETKYLEEIESTYTLPISFMVG
jgi:hypothetical protein